ncbi:MAG: hypothetical protein JNM34_13050, partial [Chthonomonadaceae bacterium]|nr:hypothetical protein [Chthonomonadaceae bacterium]
IRLANNYGKILRAIKIDDLGPAVGEKLAAFAETSVRVFSQPATRVGWNAAGYFCSAWRVLKGSVVLVKGPLAVDEATTLARRIPHRFVAPLVGQLTEGWSLKADGVYVVSPDGVAGPLTPDEVTGQLGG